MQHIQMQSEMEDAVVCRTRQQSAVAALFPGRKRKVHRGGLGGEKGEGTRGKTVPNSRVRSPSVIELTRLQLGWKMNIS